MSGYACCSFYCQPTPKRSRDGSRADMKRGLWNAFFVPFLGFPAGVAAQCPARMLHDLACPWLWNASLVFPLARFAKFGCVSSVSLGGQRLGCNGPTGRLKRQVASNFLLASDSFIPANRPSAIDSPARCAPVSRDQVRRSENPFTNGVTTLTTLASRLRGARCQKRCK